MDPATNKTIDEVTCVINERPSFLHGRGCGGNSMSRRYCAGSTNLELLVNHDVRMAEAGEFTKRAFMNGRIDLTQAEAIIDII